MSHETIFIVIAGPSGSGKSLLAETVVNELGNDQVAVISEDSYYKDNPHLSFEQRALINYDHPESVDHALLCEHLEKLKKGEPVDVPIYIHAEHRRSDQSRRVKKHKIIILEGILLFVYPALRDLLTISIFMDTELDICLGRRLKRDIQERERSVDSVLQQYDTTVRPMCLEHILPSKRYADVIIPRGGENRIAIELLKSTIKSHLNNEEKEVETWDS